MRRCPLSVRINFGSIIKKYLSTNNQKKRQIIKWCTTHDRQSNTRHDHNATRDMTAKATRDMTTNATHNMTANVGVGFRSDSKKTREHTQCLGEVHFQ